VTDHPPHLTPAGADRAQHADLTGALEHGEHQCVDDPEQAHHDRQGQQHVEDVEHAGEAGDLVVDELLAGLHLGVGKRVHHPVERARVGLALASAHLDQRVEILRLGVGAIPCLGRHRHGTERRAAVGRLEDPLDDQRHPASGGGGHHQV
jgi:hypothetical protein